MLINFLFSFFSANLHLRHQQHDDTALTTTIIISQASKQWLAGGNISSTGVENM